MINDAINTSFFCARKDLNKLQRVTFSDRKYYSIGLQLKTGRFYYGDKCILVNRPAILLSSPLSPYAWETEKNGDGVCFLFLFDDTFLDDSRTEILSIFQDLTEPIIFINSDNKTFFEAIFQRMLQAFESHNEGRVGILKNYLNIIIYEIKQLPTQSDILSYKSASQRIAELFLNMLDSQFPLDVNMRKTLLTTPSKYADKLCVHVNHLNRVVKNVTGKTTTEIITGRIIEEAKRLLQTTNLSIGEIGDLLGFEEVASFSKFVRKHTGHCPKDYRPRKNIKMAILRTAISNTHFSNASPIKVADEESVIRTFTNSPM